MRRWHVLLMRCGMGAVLAGISGCGSSGGGPAPSLIGASCTTAERAAAARMCYGKQVLVCTVDGSAADAKSTATSGGGGMTPGPPPTWQLEADCANQSEICQNGECMAQGSNPLQGYTSGTWTGACHATQLGGSFHCSIAGDSTLAGQVTGQLTSQSGGSTTFSLSGALAGDGTATATSAGPCTWSGSFAAAGGRLVGSGDYSCPDGCAGTWSTF